MPPKYRNSTPAAERVYKSTPKSIQTRFPSTLMRRSARATPSTPASLARQNTLTQMEFPTPRSSRLPSSRRRPRVQLEISDSETDDDYEESSRKKRRKIEPAKRLKPGLKKQDTLTQMDFVKLGKSLWSDEDDDNLTFPEEKPFEEGRGDNGSEHEQEHEEGYEEVMGDVDPMIESDQGHGDALCAVESVSSPVQNLRVIPDSEEMMETQTQSKVINPQDPQTPKKAHKLEIPSSQTPSGTPFSIHSRRVARARDADNEASPTPIRVRTNASIQENEREEEIQSSPVAAAYMFQAPKKSPTRATLSSPKLMEPGEIDMYHYRGPKDSQNPESQTGRTNHYSNNLQTQTLPSHETQTQTQQTPRTKIKIQEFNARWAEINRKRRPMAPPQFKPRHDAIKSHQQMSLDDDAFTLGEETQLALSNETSEITSNSQDNVTGHESDIPPASFRSERSFEIPTHEEILKSTQISSPENGDNPDSPILSKVFSRVIGSSQSPDDEEDSLPESPIKEPVFLIPTDSRQHDQDESPIHPSQATTVPGTQQLTQNDPASVEFVQPQPIRIPNNNSEVIIISSSSQQFGTSPPLQGLESLPLPAESQELPEAGTQPIRKSKPDRPPGISQLLPSSAMNSDLPSPPVWQEESLEMDD
ncbi:hypothetical protein BT63DRAFT_241509 [Microthyrium microscopicum]|uniref:Uncharacterized protein n=1 Tax=Microthyrium microscopicum TaxID=703497 RepID=A0A6A6UGK6_9PEZI|nr:hypothetical protein BT63DRAFT_241509 [Microthyrium microscopicum]